MSAPKLIEAQDLVCRFGSRGWFGRSRVVQAVSGVSLTVDRGQAVGLVGESGSGKSTIGRALLGLVTPNSGRVWLDGKDVAELARTDRLTARRRMQFVFQDPYASLDPRRRVGDQIAEGLRIHGLAPAGQIEDAVARLLEQVGLPPAHAARFPHEFSGGQRQRVGIARALATQPDFIVADEPVSALDVSVQAQVLVLLADLRSRLGLGLLFISHDLPVVRSLCDEVIVLYLGRVMERGPTAALFEQPVHPYTRALLSAAPHPKPGRQRQRLLLPGEPPSPLAPPSGCVFRTRCPWALEACAREVPTRREIAPGRLVSCLRADEVLTLQNRTDRSPAMMAAA
jgi:peptide/nickel transport system ATP-binding protein